MPEPGLTYRDLRNAILFAALVFVALVFIAHIADVILLFSIVTLAVVVLNPLVTWMNEHRLPRWLGTFAITLAFVGLLVLVSFFVIPAATKQLRQFAHDLPRLLGKINTWLADLLNQYHVSRAGGPQISLSTILQNVTPYLGGLTKITTGIAELIAAAVAIFITTIYALINPQPLSSGFLNALAPEQRPRAAAAGHRIAVQIWAWARGTAFAMVSIFLLVYLVLWLIGLREALLFAIVAGLLEVVPVVGPILGGVLPTFTALAIDPLLALWVVGSFVIIQQFENHVLIPLVMSRQVRLHPVTVIVWVFIMGALYGIVGIFLATPTAVAAGVIYDELYLREYRSRHDNPVEEDARHQNEQNDPGDQGQQHGAKDDGEGGGSSAIR